jgi:hypothetical protein
LSGLNYIVNNSLIDTLRNDDIIEIEKYDGFIMSRSNEVTNPDYLYSNTTIKKSGYITVEFSSTGSNTNLFETPKVDSTKIDIFAFQNKINNSAVNEHTNSGNAISRWISKKVSFATDRLAEDLKVYLTAYKPAGTDLKIYAKIHNSKDNQPFDDKQWTLLNAELNAGKYSSSSNTNDYIDISFGIPQYPLSNNTLSGFCTVTADSNTLSTTANLSSSIAANSLIKIYNPGVSLNYFIRPVSSVTSSTVVLANPAPSAGGANNNVIGSGFKIDVLNPKHTAFNNYLTDNVIRYYSSSMVQYDNFDTFSIKIVMLSNSTFIVPRVQDIRAIGVSA